MSLEHASISWSTKQISSMLGSGRIRTDHIVQRSDCWEKSRRSLFIDSLIRGYDIPKVYAKRFEQETDEKSARVYSMLDGKQRLTTIAMFLNNQFALTELPEITYFDEVLNAEQTIDISGKTFEELPEGMQDIIRGVTLTVVYYSNLTPEEQAELFRRLNNGKALSTKSRTLASCQNLEELLEIGSHELFEVMLTEKARENKNQVTIVMKTWCMLNQEISEISFESRIFNPMLEQVEVTPEQSQELATIFDYAYDIHDIFIKRKEKKLASKMLKETHFISLVPYFKLATDSGITEDQFADWIKEFYGVLDGTSISESYNDAANGGIAKTINIGIRDEALKESYQSFFYPEIEEVAEESEVIPETEETNEAIA